MNKKLLIFAVMALTAMSSLSCSYRYTKEFHLKDKFPTRRTEFSLIDNLPDRFGPWVVQAHLWSVFESKNRKKIEANNFMCGLYFRLPEDTSVWKLNDEGKLTYALDEMFENDTSIAIVSVDSVNLTFEPEGVQKVLAAKAGPHRSFDCGLVLVPESVDSLTLRFTARLENPDGTEIMRKQFEARFYRWEYRWNAWLPLE